MSFGKPLQCQLTPRAADDLEEIWRFSAERWSITQADRTIDDLTQLFEMIAAMSTLGRERREFDPPVRIHVHESHLIIYISIGDYVQVLRLLGARQNWTSILKAADQ